MLTEGLEKGATGGEATAKPVRPAAVVVVTLAALLLLAGGGLLGVRGTG